MKPPVKPMLIASADSLLRCEAELRVLIPLVRPDLSSTDVAEMELTARLIKILAKKFQFRATRIPEC
jgi:hypothetical protein